MKLTGKCKEEFEKWFNTDLPNEKGLTDDQIIEVRIGKIELFNRLTFPMQIGVLQLYFDSVGIIMEIQVHTEPTMQGAKFKKFRPEILVNGTFNNVGASFGIRERAWKQAVEKANEIRNEQLK